MPMATANAYSTGRGSSESLWSNRNFRLLLIGSSVSWVGDQFYYTGGLTSAAPIRHLTNLKECLIFNRSATCAVECNPMVSIGYSAGVAVACSHPNVALAKKRYFLESSFWVVQANEIRVRLKAHKFFPSSVRPF